MFANRAIRNDGWVATTGSRMTGRFFGGWDFAEADELADAMPDKLARGKREAAVGGRFGIVTFGIGEDSGQPVTHDYLRST
jgi:hypothetical protein